MRRIVVGESILWLTDPDAPMEAEFEGSAAQALACFFPKHRCFVFSGGFRLDAKTFRPDLAMIAEDFSHWFVVEVELVTHSLDRHVLPQVRAFRYGDPLDDCASKIAEALGVTQGQAMTLVQYVPRAVAVVANKHDVTWEIALRSHGIQMLVVSTFSSPSGEKALELEGNLEIVREHLGFAEYSATDRSLRLPCAVRLPDGQIQISDPAGSSSVWTVVRDGAFAWITKNIGQPSIEHGTYVQIIRTIDGRITLRRP